MAARFWRLLLALELAAAAGIVWGITLLLVSMPPAAALALTLVIFLLLQIVLVAGSQLLGRVLTEGASITGVSSRVCFTEGRWFLLAKLAMSIEPWLAQPEDPPPSSTVSERPLLLIHGVLCNRAIWLGLKRRLRAAGFAPVRALNLTPLLGDIDEYARQVVRELSILRTQARGAPVSIIAHSMGGLGRARRSAQRCRRGEPHRHHRDSLTTAACWPDVAPGAAARQMRPGSAWLERLNAASERRPTPITSIYSADDNFVAPAGSAVLADAELCAVQGVGHFGLLHSPRVLNCVLAALKRGTPASEAT